MNSTLASLPYPFPKGDMVVYIHSLYLKDLDNLTDP